MRPRLFPRFPAAPPRILGAVALVLIAGSGASLAQDSCVGLLKRNITSGGTNGANAVFATYLDDDEYLDVVSASFNNDRIIWYENLMTAPEQPLSFAQHTITKEADGATAVFAADLDGDGDTDVLAASANDDTIAWHENIGDPPQFVRRVITGSAVQASSVFAANMDEDPHHEGIQEDWDIDVLAASFLDGTLAWYENLKSAENPVVSFAEHVISSDWPGASAIAAADLDGDGDGDVVAASYLMDTVAWFESELGYEYGEDGTATEVLFFTEHPITTEADGATSLFLIDLDDDTDLDLLVASSEDNTIAWWENRVGEDSPWVEHVISTDVGGATSVHAAAAGDALVVLAASADDGTIAVYERVAQDPPLPPLFVLSTTEPGGTSLDAVFAADLDGRNGIDALSASSVPGPISSADKIAWYENDGGSPLSLTEHVISGTAEGARAVFAANLDLDDSGLMDVVSAGGVSTLGWYENQLQAEPPGWVFHLISADDAGPSSVYAANVDADTNGFVDIVAAFDGADKIALYRNDGGQPPSFTEEAIDPGARGASAVFVQDMNGDENGYLDVVSASFDDDRIAWHENTAGDGSAWTTHVIATDADGATSVAAADMNGDGHQDVISASFYDDKLAWYENTAGDGSAWTTHVIATDADGARSVAVADLDSDGDRDVLVASALSGEITWYENEVDADDPDARTFTEHLIADSATFASSVTAEDLDGDDDEDVLVTAAGNARVAWYENDGESPPSFTEHLLLSTAIQPRALVVENFDGDAENKLDLFVGFDFETAWYENRGEICDAFDVSGDSRIDGVELAWLARAFGWSVVEGEAQWWAPVDYNTDGIVDGADLAILTSAGVWGQTVDHTVGEDAVDGTCQYTCQ